MRRRPSIWLVVPFWFVVATASAGTITVVFNVDAGGNTSNPLNGLEARATFTTSGTQMTVLLENTSTGVPSGFLAADSLLVSIGFSLPTGILIATGDAAVVADGSLGIGSWTGRVAGDSVAEEWLWTNEYGGDLMSPYAQVISTSDGQGGGSTTRFDGGSGSVNGPYGGMAADPPILNIHGSKPAVSNSILFTVTLSGNLSDSELESMANAGIVEFGSDARYLHTPEPAALALGALCVAAARRRG